MENKCYSIVVDYIAKEFNLKKTKLNAEISLSDIGLDGDDVLDFLLKFFKDFEIEYEQTNYKDFIPKESGFVFETILSLFSLLSKKERKNINNDEIFVKDLVLSLETKRWYKLSCSTAPTLGKS